MEGNVSSQSGREATVLKLGRFLFHWCAAFGAIILLAFQSLTAFIVPSTVDYEAPGPVALFGSVVFGIFIIYVGATTYQLAHCEKAVLKSQKAGLRIMVLFCVSVLALLRGIWWIADLAGGRSDSIFNYVGMAWFTVAGLVGIPLAWMLLKARKNVLQQG